MYKINDRNGVNDMKKSFTNTSWIWYTEFANPDTYGDFMDELNYNGGKVICHISCDGDYTLFVNGGYVSSNQYGDFEHYKIYDSIDITDHLVIGENTILITVWHLGIASSRYKPAKAGLFYEIECDGKSICRSCEETLSRENPNYKGGYKKIITSQMGQSFLFDETKSGDAAFHNSFVVDKKCEMYPRPIAKSQLLKEKKITVLKNTGDYFLLDLGEETVGLPILNFYTDVSQKITVCWGEHIIDGNVRRKIGNRDFSFEYIAKKGENNYINYMLRLGCRYLEVFCEAPIKLDYIGIIPQAYPAEVIPRNFADPLKQKIYDLSVNTLKLCMLERYVDTPWREQSFYTFDSRNQMLCGYKAFKNGNRDYARAALILISQDTREDDLLSITYPSGTELAIPSFSLHYFTAIKEYLDNTNDLSLATEVYEKLLKIIRVFEKQIQDGLLYTFRDSGYWNFYDWSAYMDEKIGSTDTRSDLMINCLFIIALENFKTISDRIHKSFNYQDMMDAIKANIKRNFFDSKNGLFSMSKEGKEFTELGNAVAILAGLTTPEESYAIAENLSCNKLLECSLSMKCFKYDALLKVDSKYHQCIIQEICDTYKVMLDNDATSVWEVIEGADAFGKAGSLCHGWSAIPILYL
ncbi:MAG: hypothetical protein IJP34_02580 [Clostridia bacterium]|nr:hypothetical protein [Clostridia bacterium]